MENKILLIGFSLSGKWAYNLSIRQGYMPIIYDDEFMTQDMIDPYLKDIGFAIVSPAIQPNHPIIEKLELLNIPIISEIEFAYQFRNKNSNLVGVTGTNGKTTVVRLIESILKNNCIVAGNIGIPFSKVVDNRAKNIILELSSFQLNKIYTFLPDIAVFTNLAPDHIDYHKTYENYKKAKVNLIKNRTDNTIIIYSGEDEELTREILALKHKNSYYFSENRKSGYGIFIENNKVVVADKFREDVLFDLKELPPLAHHNLLNYLTASLVCYNLGVSNEIILQGLKQFTPSPYRQQVVKNNLGITIINDSKSTNLASTLAAVKNFKENICLIVGGKPKNEDYSKLFTTDCNLVKVIAYGESRFEFSECARLHGYKNLVVVEKLLEAVELALSSVKKGEVVLFSPACSSFDQFSSYLERGKAFDEIIKKHKKLG